MSNAAPGGSRPFRHPYIVTALLVLAVLMAGYTLVSVERLSGRVSTFSPLSIEDIRKAVRTEVGAMLEAEWQDSRGIIRRVRTTKGEPGFEDETESQFQARHDARVNAQLLKYPK